MKNQTSSSNRRTFNYWGIDTPNKTDSDGGKETTRQFSCQQLPTDYKREEKKSEITQEY